jgi:von Willebrand factor type A domain.
MEETMGDKMKLDGAKEAAKNVISVLLPQDRVSVVSFAGTATTETGFTSNFEEAKRRIDRINFDDATSFGAGLNAALNQFDSRGTSDHISAVLFMSDGGHNTKPDPYPYVVQCKDRKIPIFTVGFAATESEVDVENLTMMSDATPDGEYVFVDDIFDLENTFLELHDKASDLDPISEYVGKVSPGRTVIAGAFEVAAYMACLRVTLNWPGSDMDLILYDPSGEEVDFNAPHIIYSRDTKPEYVIINDPEPGIWTAMVYGKELDCTEDYYLLASSYEPTELETWSRIFDGSVGNGAKSVQQTSDGGYIMVGWTTSYGAVGGDVWLVKTDSFGNKMWEKRSAGLRVRGLIQSRRRATAGTSSQVSLRLTALVVQTPG